jgi:hypothetical protein
MSFSPFFQLGGGTPPEQEVKRVRARTKVGQFQADDPDTPEVNEAWTKVPAGTKPVKQRGGK